MRGEDSHSFHTGLVLKCTFPGLLDQDLWGWGPGTSVSRHCGWEAVHASSKETGGFRGPLCPSTHLSISPSFCGYGEGCPSCMSVGSHSSNRGRQRAGTEPNQLPPFTPFHLFNDSGGGAGTGGLGVGALIARGGIFRVPLPLEFPRTEQSPV